MSDATPDTPQQPWARRPDETDKAFAAFQAYRDLPAKARSQQAAYEAYVEERDGDRRQNGGKPAARSKPPGYFCAWSSKHGWEDRAAAYDAYVDQKAREAGEEDYFAQLQDFRRRQLEWAEVSAKGARQLLDVVLERIEEIEASDIAAGDLWKHVKAITELMESAAAMEREALGVERVVVVLQQEGRL